MKDWPLTDDDRHYPTLEADLERYTMPDASSSHARGDKLTGDEALRLQEYIMSHALAILGPKRRDYSGQDDPFRNFRSAEALGVEPWRGAFVRLLDKISRVRSVVEAGGNMEVRESLVDTFADMVNYTCIAAGLVWEALGLEIPDVDAD